MSVVVQDVLALASFGMYPVRLHYPIFSTNPTTCSCGSPTCFVDSTKPNTSVGKHPVEKDWGKSSTDDTEVIEQRWSSAGWNVGIILGICHGIPADQAIIDIEDDSPEGRAFADILLDGFPSPCYSSGKSIHRLYRWTPNLPDTANMTINGLEFRFGGGSKATQSVAPPSVHYSGATYDWIEGKGLEDIPIIPLPDHIVAFLNEEHVATVAKGPKGTSSTDPHKFKSPQGMIGPGARHHSLLIYANHLWRIAFNTWGINEISEQEAADQVWMWLLGANKAVCDPPKSDAELQVLFQSSQSYMLGEFQRELEEKLALSYRPEPDLKLADEEVFVETRDTFGNWLHKHGIHLLIDPEHAPTQMAPDRIDQWACDWSLSYITHADEEIVELSIPGFDKPITLKLLELSRAEAVGRRIQAETEGEFTLLRTFPLWDWLGIWEGRNNDKARKNGITRGLKEYLMTSAGVKAKIDGGLQEQVEDIVSAMCGNIAEILTGVEYVEQHGKKIEGRLKMALGGGGITNIKMPEDTQTGYYMLDGKINMQVKLDEVNRRYRASFGTGIATRTISECFEQMGMKKESVKNGAGAGRWFLKEIIE